ncbi:RING-H2 finger protein ATL47 [Bienertia sinuspersici]
MIFFVAGILHLLIRYLMKRPSFYSSNSVSNSRTLDSNNNNSNSGALQRQLQQLFRLHDSGLDQALIDALPVFYYKDIMGLKEPFDCAVCLCEFSDQDKLRLLPLCSHAFHISCIDTWLLSNSTCPLCRGSLLGSELENQENSFNNTHNVVKPSIMEENSSERRVFSVRLGKFRNLDDRGETDHSKGFENGETSGRDGGRGGGGGGGVDGSSSRQLDARRCYSLGSYQYVVAESNLQVELSTDNNVEVSGTKIEKLMVDGDIEGKKISRRNKRDSFSVSKIWLWSKKSKFPSSSENNVNGINGGPPPLNVVLPLSTTRDHVFH